MMYCNFILQVALQKVFVCSWTGKREMEGEFSEGGNYMKIMESPIFEGCGVLSAHRYQNAGYRLTNDWKMTSAMCWQCKA